MNRSDGEVEAFKAVSRIKSEFSRLDSKLELCIGDDKSNPKLVTINLEGHGEFEIDARYGVIDAGFFDALLTKIKEQDYE